MSKKFFWAPVFLLILGSLSCKAQTSYSPYMLFIEDVEDTVPAIFGDGFISDRYNNRDMAISPDGKEIYFTLQSHKKGKSFILYTHLASGRWTKPEIAFFSGEHNDLEPAFSPDGERLYFVSNRPTEFDSAKSDFDIWYMVKTVEGWSEPINPGKPINTEGNEFYPSVSLNGNLYFTAEKEKGIGKEDIYVSYRHDGIFSEPKCLSDSINSPMYEFNAFIDPNESFIIFTSYGREDYGGGDLYISYRKDSTWTTAQNMGPGINSPALDYCPSFGPEGEFFFYTSSRKLELPEIDELNIDLLKSFFNRSENGLEDIYVIGRKHVIKDLTY